MFLQETHVLHSKTHNNTKNTIKVGDVVLVADTDMPCNHWSLGIIEKLLPGSDDLCRATVVCTANGHTTCSVIKLYPLKLNISSEEKEEKEENVPENHKEHSVNYCPTQHVARAAREMISAQLIDMTQD